MYEPTIRISPTNRLVAFIHGGNTKVWDIVAGQEACRVPAEGCIAFQPDESQIILAGSATSVWNLNPVQEVPTTFGTDQAKSVAISRDGRRVYFLGPTTLRVYSNERWNHLLTYRGPLPRTASEVDACFEEFLQADRK